ncbi:MAG: glycosyltransferase [Chloroflexi bacterium]|nr:glycosyltransferase [Chloroflexota bacterium]
MSLRVAMISVHTSPLATLGGKEAGGMNVYVRDLSRELALRGMAVDVFTRQQSPDVSRVREFAPNARVIHLPAGPPAPYDKHKLFQHLPEFTQALARFAEQERISYSLLHSHYWLSGWVAHELRRQWPIPLVHMFHTLGHMKNAVAAAPEEMETDLRIQTEGQIMHWADCLVAASPLEKAQMAWLYGAAPAKIRVIPAGVDTERFHPIPVEVAKAHIGIPQERKLILFVGRIEPLKGIETLFRAIAILAKETPCFCENICVSIIGGEGEGTEATRSAEEERLRELREQLELRDLVTFLGSKDQDALPYYYSAAYVVVVPSYYESFGMVAVEAMACGVPVIASKAGGLMYTIQDGLTGLLFPSNSPAALAEKLCMLLDEPELRDKMGENARQWAQRFAWPNIADQIVALYGELLSRQAATLTATRGM